MTWWRQSRDSFGKTIPQRLTFDIFLLEEAIAARNIERDKEWISWARSHIKRIRSILRRLKRCPKCHGTLEKSPSSNLKKDSSSRRTSTNRSARDGASGMQYE